MQKKKHNNKKEGSKDNYASLAKLKKKNSKERNVKTCKPYTF